jgi:membrane protease YdiL (CAAX protease family)
VRLVLIIARMRSSADVRQGQKPIAPLWHTCCMLVLLGLISAHGVYLRMESAHPRVGHLPMYAKILVNEWAIFALSLWRSDAEFVGYVARAVRNPRSLLPDIAVAAALCAVLLFAVTPLVTHVLGRSGWSSSAGIAPHGVVEVALWFVVSISAGVCEETVFRGYFQQQISGWTGSQVVGVFGQAAIFGLCHAYQGWKKVALISVWGCVFGAFVWWRKGLRANMIAHAVLDSLAAF